MDYRYETLSNEESIKSARIAFGHIKDRSDIDCLCLRISQLNRMCEMRLVTIESLFEQVKHREAEISDLKSRLKDYDESDAP